MFGICGKEGIVTLIYYLSLIFQERLLYFYVQSYKIYFLIITQLKMHRMTYYLICNQTKKFGIKSSILKDEIFNF